MLWLSCARSSVGVAAVGRCLLPGLTSPSVSDAAQAHAGEWFVAARHGVLAAEECLAHLLDGSLAPAHTLHALGNAGRRALDPQNAVARARVSGQAFVYYHTHVVDRLRVAAASEQARSIEFDVYAAPGAAPTTACGTIAHPPSFYTHKCLPPPDHMGLEEAVRLFEAGRREAALVLDVKSRAALPLIARLVERLGTERVILHAFASELSFDVPPTVAVEPHWADEDIPVADVFEAASPPGLPYRAAVMLTCRHVTADLIEPTCESLILRRIENVAADQADVIGLWLPGGAAPSAEVASFLLERGLLVSFNLDSQPRGQVGFSPPYVAMTDVFEMATKLADSVA